jgi:cell division protein ZapE
MFGPISSVYYDRINHGDLQEDPAQALLLDKLDLLYDQLHKPFWQHYFTRKNKGLYIVGDVGRGKTYLMDLLYEKVKIPKQRLHYHIFINTIHEQLAKYKKKTWDNLAKEFYAKGALLCLDEFQFSDMGNLMILFQFFRKFFQLGGILVTTSNFKPEEFHLSDNARRNQFLEFLLQHVDIFSLDKGPDYRLKGRENCRRVFVDQKITSLANFFNRSIRKDLRECTYNFHSLFEMPVGSAYYDELLKKCDSIIITDFRQLTDDDENSLLRFMQLIDLLYESKISLFLYSHVALKDIYVGQKYIRPFQRTLSRLLEITSR